MFAKVENGKVVTYPIHDIKSLFPNVSFPADYSVLPRGFVKVHQHDPEPAKFKKVIEALPEKVNGVYIQQWDYVDLETTDLEKALKKHVKELNDGIQSALDKFAKARGYDNILAACSYAMSNVPQYAADAQKAIDVRDSVWKAADELFKKVADGKKAMPNDLTEVLIELPVMEWN